MTQEELLRETNGLIKRLLELDTQRREEMEQSKVQSDKMLADMNKEREEKMKVKLEERGAPTEGTEEDWQKRLDEARQKSRENMELVREKDLKYKEELLQELRTQSDLLTQISEKLG